MVSSNPLILWRWLLSLGTNQNVVINEWEELTVERTNKNTAYNKEEELTTERTNKNTAYTKGGGTNDGKDQ